jgi:hypothetical protein
MEKFQIRLDHNISGNPQKDLGKNLAFKLFEEARKHDFVIDVKEL